MLEYVKTILSKVSFDAVLFEKELRKGIKLLIRDEVEELRKWCYSNYNSEYHQVLHRCFAYN
jgi:hypothetical protein